MVKYSCTRTWVQFTSEKMDKILGDTPENSKIFQSIKGLIVKNVGETIILDKTGLKARETYAENHIIMLNLSSLNY